MEFLGGGSCLDLVLAPVISLSRQLILNSSNLVPSTKPTSQSFVENSFSDWSTCTKKARYTETSRLRMYCYPRLGRSNLQISESLHSSRILNHNETRLLAHRFGWLLRLYSKLDMILRRTYGHWESLQLSLSMENPQMPPHIR